MTALDKIKALAGIKNPEQEAQERQEAIQKEQLEIQKRPSSTETAQSIALMKNASGDSQYELGALSLDAEADIEEFKSQLRGFRWVPVEVNGRIEYKKEVFGKPALNEDGVNFLVNTVRFYASKTFALTNYTGTDKRAGGKEMIATRCKYIARNVAAALTLNREKWEVDPIKRGVINMLTQDFIEACMSRSLDMKTAGHYYGSNKTLAHINQNVAPDVKDNKNSWFR